MRNRSPAAGLAVLACLGGAVSGADDREREAAVLVAVFRQQVQEHMDPTEKARRTVLCLAVDPGGAPQSPSRELMARLAGEPSLRRAAECDG